MSGTDIARFGLIIILGFLALVAFLVAGTIIGLMWLESSHCNCAQLPVGLYVLALFGILLIASLISEGLDAPLIFEGWLENQRERLIIAIIIFFVIILVLI